MYLSKRDKEIVDPADQLEIAFSILNYNQNLIQFADSKANALLLINSIFIASLGAFLPTIKSDGSTTLYLVFLLFMVACIFSLLLALGVIMTRSGTSAHTPPRSLFYFGHIADFSTADSYCHEFAHAEIEHVRQATLANVYVLAKIAQGKFAVYHMAQTATLISSSLWMITMVILFFT